ncbi:MAG: FAD binding domain-containing protein [Mycobacterium leprae]
MKPPRFDYYSPTSVEEVLALLQQHGDAAKLLAGGQSLMPLLNMRLAKPEALIDLGRVEGLSYIRREDGVLAIGAMTTQAAVEQSELVAQYQPLLREAEHHVGHIQIRNRGTIGGSLAHADPSAELPAVMVALDATMRVAGPTGIREIAADDFFLMYFTTALTPQEVLVEVRVPVLPANTGYAFAELARRHGDSALAAVACTLTLAPDGTVADCRLALVGVDMTPLRARDAERMLIGQIPAPDLLAKVAGAVRGAVEPEGDVHATAPYRKELAGTLTERALGTALARATGARPEGGADS